MSIHNAVIRNRPGDGGNTAVGDFAGHLDDELHGGFAEVRIRGRNTLVPAARIAGRTVVVVGRWLKIARVKDELFLPGTTLENPDHVIEQLRRHGLKAHVFVFSQKAPDSIPRFDYPVDWDNVAILPTGDYEAWWHERLSRQTRKNIRRAQKMGVDVRGVELDDAFVRGVTDIYNETPVRQGRPFYHYGKDFDTIKRELSTFAATSEFLGAYKDGELIGFVKLVHMGRVTSIMHILSKNMHFDKRPTNALLAETVAVCHRRGVDFLVYGSYTYGRKVNSSLEEFKRRNGFEKLMIPTYYIPLTPFGRIIVALKLHRGIIGLLPSPLISALLTVRESALKAALAFRR